MKFKAYKNRFGGYGIAPSDATVLGDGIDIAACRDEKRANQLCELLNSRDELLAFAQRYLDSDATTPELDKLAKAALAKATKE